MMKILVIFFCLIIIALNSILASSPFFYEKSPVSGVDFVTPDGSWPVSCPIPECEKIEKSVKYPSPQAR
jgi:hypothetical protein